MMWFIGDFEVGLPRLLVLWMTGASLACAGAMMQGVFANPLASPTVLGTSSGGSLFILLTLFLSGHLISPLLLPFSGFIGCLFSLSLIYLLAKTLKAESTAFLLLIGIAFSTFIASLQGAILYGLRGNWELIQLLTEWNSGSTSFITWRDFHLQFPLACIGIWGAWKNAEKLNLLSLGEEEALHLGLDVQKTRWIFFILVALLLSGALATIGDVPFLGLIVPHMARLLVGANHKKLLPLSALLGALTLTLLDLFIRYSPYSIAMNPLAGILGGLAFISLLIHQTYKKQYNLL